MKLIQLSVRRIEATLESIQDSIIHSDKIPTSKHNGVAFIQRKKRTQTKKIDETIAKKQGLKHNWKSHRVLFFIINNSKKFEIQLVKFCFNQCFCHSVFFNHSSCHHQRLRPRSELYVQACPFLPLADHTLWPSFQIEFSLILHFSMPFSTPRLFL